MKSMCCFHIFYVRICFSRLFNPHVNIDIYIIQGRLQGMWQSFSASIAGHIQNIYIGCGGSVFGPCIVMQYLASLLVI